VIRERHDPVETAHDVVALDLLWIPLGAGQVVVRASGRMFEAVKAFAQHRRACALYHSALIVSVPEGRFVIEMAPIPDRHGDRGVVAEGVVGTKLVGRLRVFRYEIRRWCDGIIPDEALATARQRVDVDAAQARRLLELVPTVPTPVWGRDDLDAGEMWNSNSVTSWLLQRAQVDTGWITPPHGGRAPGWGAGIVVAARDSKRIQDRARANAAAGGDQDLVTEPGEAAKLSAR
jgi:hypothetical protein